MCIIWIASKKKKNFLSLFDFENELSQVLLREIKNVLLTL